MTDERFQLYDTHGQRKYLSAPERQAFLAASGKASREVRTFCLALTYTGCRISEALALTADREMTVGYEMADMADKAGVPGDIKITKVSQQGAHVVEVG